MNQIQHSTQFLRRRKFLLMLPVLMLPFLVLLFVALGGGKGTSESSANKTITGLNVKLPDAHFKKGNEKSKLSIYDEAGRDSAKLRDRIKNDPYYLLQHHDVSDMSFDSSNMMKHSFSPGVSERDENETKIMEKLAKLKSVIRQKSEPAEADPRLTYSSDLKTSSFEKLMPPRGSENIHDPRMEQITAMLDKVMAIQHPEIMQDSIARLLKGHSQVAFHVKLNRPYNDPETFGPGKEDEMQPSKMNRFYDLSDEMTIQNELDNAIEAVIPETQTLVSGSTIKLRLLNDVRINDHLIGKNQFVYGTTTLSNERLKIQFSSIRYGNNILPVSMEAFDLDGLAGIYIPGSINRDVAKQSTDQAIGSIGINSLDPSIGAQAAGAGIQAAKTLLSRKVKLIKVTVKVGYRVLLKDSKDK
jgi:conjugative transposon TraM protein